MRLVREVRAPEGRVLFLGYSEADTAIVNAIVEKNYEVWHTDDRIATTEGFDIAISFGYRHILRQDVIRSSPAPIVNLHISYLPYNRGAHPNFWSFFDGTPSGVSIHLIDEGVDTGAIICQRYVNFSKNETTFVQTYKRLILEIEELFVENIDLILSRKFDAVPQRRKGTYHKLSELPTAFSGWESDIRTEIERLDRLLAGQADGGSTP
jgi:methionyl-tRNA formyltransferase